MLMDQTMSHANETHLTNLAMQELLEERALSRQTVRRKIEILIWNIPVEVQK